ncbi:hypothetical protein HK096_007174 [Nowakowskiella sp. JEL0078]|nr:hypothetical protein HK096_007174 [Nowakowskiella sp. JEL0078]
MPLEITIHLSPNSAGLFEGFPGLGPVRLAGIVKVTNRRTSAAFVSPKPVIISALDICYFGETKITTNGQDFLDRSKGARNFEKTLSLVGAPENNHISTNNIPLTPVINGDEEMTRTVSRNEIAQVTSNIPANVTVFPDQTVEFPYEWIISYDDASTLLPSVEANKSSATSTHGSTRYFCRASCIASSGDSKNIMTALKSFLTVGKMHTASVSRSFIVQIYDRKLIQRFLRQYQHELQLENKKISWLPSFTRDPATESADGIFYAAFGPDDDDTVERALAFPSTSLFATSSQNDMEEKQRDEIVPWSPKTPRTIEPSAMMLLPEPTPLMLPRMMNRNSLIYDPGEASSSTSTPLATDTIFVEPTPLLLPRKMKATPPSTPSSIKKGIQELPHKLSTSKSDINSEAWDTPSSIFEIPLDSNDIEFSPLPESRIPSVASTSSVIQQPAQSINDKLRPTVVRRSSMPKGIRIMKDFSGTTKNVEYWVGLSSIVLARGGILKMYFRIRLDDSISKKKLKYIEVRLEEYQELVDMVAEVTSRDYKIIASSRASEIIVGDFQFWKRTQSSLSWRWVVTDIEKDERKRHNFRPFKDMFKVSLISGEWEPYFPRILRIFRQVVSFFVILVWIGVVIVSVIAQVALKAYIANSITTYQAELSVLTAFFGRIFISLKD